MLHDFMGPTLPLILLGTFLGGVASVLLASAVLALPRHWADRAAGFAMGVLLATTLVHLIPEVIARLPQDVAGGWLLSGLAAFFLLERLIGARAPAGSGPAPTLAGHKLTTARLILLGDALHNFVDGALIAAAFLADAVLGWATAIAVLAHELPQELGDYMILVAAGLSRGQALLWNALSGAAAMLGGVTGWLALQQSTAVLPYVLALAAASFLYIALAGLAPWLHSQHGRFATLTQCTAICSGAGVILALHHVH